MADAPDNLPYVVTDISGDLLPNARRLIASDGLQALDSGPLQTINIVPTLNLANLYSLTGLGIVCKTDINTFTVRSVTSDGSISITNPGGLNNNINLSVVDNTSIQAVQVAVNSDVKGQAPLLNFIPALGAGVSVNQGVNVLDITLTSAGAAADATFITQTPSDNLPNEQAISTISGLPGILKASSGGVLSKAAPGTDYLLPTNNLNSLNAVTPNLGTVIVGNGTGWQALTPGSPGTVITSTGTNIEWGLAGSGAPVNATYITQTPNSTLTNEQALSVLNTGLLKNTNSTGILTIAIQGTDYYAPGGVDVAIADGGTGASTAEAAFDNLSPTVAPGDMIYRGATNNDQLPIGASGFIMASTGSQPEWVDFDDYGALLKSGGTMTGSLILASNPSVALEAATKQYVDSIGSGLTVLAACELATTTALPANTYDNGTAGVGATLTANANGALSVDGVAVTETDRVLIKNEAAPANNGIYTVTAVGDGSNPYILTRATDFDTSSEVKSGAYTLINGGATLANSGWMETGAGPFTIGTTPIVFTLFSSPGNFVAGTGISILADVISLVTPVAISNGGTNATTQVGAFNNLSPLTTRGDLITRDATNNIRLAIGASGTILRSDGTDANWSATTNITQLGTITTGTWNATPIGILYGGTGQTTQTAAFNALSPTTTRGDLITRDASNNVRLALGASDTWLRSNGTDATWASTTLITALGTITTGVWNGTTIAIANGGTGQTSAANAFNALAPSTATGGLIVGSGTNTYTNLPAGTNGYVLTLVAGSPAWAAESGGAPADATYIVQTPNGTLSNEQALSALSTGLMKNTTTTGVVSIAAAGTDYYSPGNPTYLREAASGVFNLSVGTNALDSLSGGTGNVAFGYNALTAITSGNNSAAFGYQALLQATGTNNIGIGYQAGGGITTGTNNIFMGSNSGAAATVTGTHNIGIGVDALNLITSGSSNIVMGSNSGDSFTTATENVSIGRNSLGTATVSNNNVAIGQAALQTYNRTSDTSGNMVAIGSGALLNATNGQYCVAIGQNAAVGLTTGSGNVVVGPASFAAACTGNNNTAIGYGVGAAMTSGEGNFLGGALAGDALTSGSNNVAIGYASLSSATTASSCVGIGYFALANYNRTSDSFAAMVAVGRGALQNATTAQFSVGVGSDALSALTTGAFNSGLGHQALQSATTVSYCTAIGGGALGSYNRTADSDGYMTALGYNSLNAATTGQHCVGLGQSAGVTITTGSQNTCIGSNADVNSATAANRTALGYGASCTADNSIQLGNSSVTLINTSGQYKGLSVFLNNTSDPSTPTGGGILYAKSGALYWIGSSGNITQIAVA